MGLTRIRKIKGWHEHPIKDVSVIEEYIIKVCFTNGVVKELDCAALSAIHSMYRPLFDDYDLFSKVCTAPRSYSIWWNSDIDLGSEYIWDNGKTVETLFDGLLSMKEATQMWGLNETTLRKALERGKLEKDVDAKKFAGQWVLSKGAVEREYGLSIPDRIKMNEDELSRYDDPDSNIMKYYKEHPEEKYKIETDKELLKSEIEKLKSKLNIVSAV